MRTNKLSQKNYTNNISEIQLVLPITMEFLIPEDDSVRLLSQILEGLNYSHLMQAYSHLGRKPSVHPKNLFKVLVYAYMNKIYSSRDIEKACKRDINFMWLLQGDKAPDHNTINRFRGERLKASIENLFYQLIERLSDLGEIEFKNIFIDGTKLEANANKYSFVWKKSTHKFELKLQEKTQLLIGRINEHFKTTFEIPSKIEVSHLQVILMFLNQKKEEKNLSFVYGKGKRKSKLQRFNEEIMHYIERQQKYDRYNSIFDGRNSFSKTDTDATFMHMKEDHMRNSQLKPGYNIQIGVEGEYIVGAEIFSDRSDQPTLLPFLDKVSDSLSNNFKNVIADAGYESEENYCELEKRGYNSYIKPQNYETTKSKSFKNKISRRENMSYDDTNDRYICHNNKILNLIGTKVRTSKSGYKSQVKIYECENCNDCLIKSKCTRAKGNKQLHVSPVFMEKRELSLSNISSPQGIKLRMNRSIQVEGAFGVLKQDYGFRRFLTRGKANVKIEFLLLCFGYNLNKLHRKIQNDKCGVSFFEKDIA